MTRRLALRLEYEGTRYAGFQLQPDAPTVQGVLEGAIEQLTGTTSRAHGAGRTDAGVHACGQVVAFDTESSLAVERFRPGLNHYLPEDVAVLAAYEVEGGFDPRRHAQARVYRYSFLESGAPSPLRRRHLHAVHRTLDVPAMTDALAQIVGEHDFAPFCGQLPTSGVTVRRMERAVVWRTEDEVHLELEGNAFLHQQVRRIAGSALEVGLGKITIDAFGALAGSGRRGAAASVLPACGLCLRQVRYEEFPPLQPKADGEIGEAVTS